MNQQRQIISHIPHRGMTGREWGLVVQAELVPMWFGELSEIERGTIRKRGVFHAPVDALAKLDEIILKQAETLGWRIGLSDLVRYRFSEWDLHSDGPDKHERYGLACKRSALIMQRKELPPVTDPDQKAVKRETVAELRMVLKRMRTTLLLDRKKTPTRPKINELFFSIIDESPELPHLRATVKRWRQFIEERPAELLPFAESGRTMPANLYDAFNGWSSGWKQESLRQAISELAPLKL